MSKFNAISAGIVAGTLMGALALPAVSATAQPVPATGTVPVVQSTDDPSQYGNGQYGTGQYGAGSSFTGPGLTGSSTTGSSGSLNSGSSGSSGGSAEGTGGILGRLLRGLITGS